MTTVPAETVSLLIRLSAATPSRRRLRLEALRWLATKARAAYRGPGEAYYWWLAPVHPEWDGDRADHTTPSSYPARLPRALFELVMRHRPGGNFHPHEVRYLMESDAVEAVCDAWRRLRPARRRQCWEWEAPPP